MRLGFDLTLQQTQKLIMTPELRQAIKILQYSSLEIVDHVKNQIESNPMLDFNIKTNSDDQYNSIDWKDYAKKQSFSNYEAPRDDKDDNDYSFEKFYKVEESLKEHIMIQLEISELKSKQREIGEFIIECIDDNGYLSVTLETISQQLSVSIQEVEDVLELIQTFDPVGIGSLNLKDCLMLQLDYKFIDDPNVYEVVENYLEDVAYNRITKISKELSITSKRVQEIFDIIKSLEPKPGRGFSNKHDDIKFVKPDVTLEQVNGEFVIVVNDNTAPRLIISNYYKKLLSSGDENTTKYLNNKFNSAMWLIKSIEQRRQTIYNVVKSILKYQGDFFIKGDKALKPLTLKEVAGDIGVHESTVSRATNGKYIQTPKGLFELKYFFSSGVNNTEGGIAATSIKSMIKEMISGENTKKPLSDQVIANKLKEKGIKISRRTVAKYRDELNIPSSSGRRRF
ncbi:RNA polymerase factor sigma-54 [Abyssisolibacter fermentans]|uniref:RNA polymerase factor sigma-54 n=1 Tax=Abyssisolibacter fermentans TaxID=1766203 RepID=UPI00082C77B7|nr:RNA polymerase factor sigma-54 [Abyssisolibacter fermentans]